jgi:hypothetical protein
MKHTEERKSLNPVPYKTFQLIKKNFLPIQTRLRLDPAESPDQHTEYSKFTTPLRNENQKFQHENEILKANKHASVE